MSYLRTLSRQQLKLARDRAQEAIWKIGGELPWKRLGAVDALLGNSPMSIDAEVQPHFRELYFLHYVKELQE